MVTGERLRLAFKNAGIPLAQVAEHIGISQTSLYNILKKDSFEIEYLKKAAELLGMPASSFLDNQLTQGNSISVIQTGDFNQAGNSNSQKIKTSKAPSQELASELAACQRELEVTRASLPAKTSLSASCVAPIPARINSYAQTLSSATGRTEQFRNN